MTPTNVQSTPPIQQSYGSTHYLPVAPSNQLPVQLSPNPTSTFGNNVNNVNVRQNVDNSQNYQQTWNT